MAVDAIVGDVGEPVFEPLDRNVALEGGVLDLGIGLEPVDPLAMLAPEGIRIGNALLIPFEIGRVVNERAFLADFITG